MSGAPRLEILEYCETPIGVLCLRRRELLASPGTIVTEVTLDHEFLMSSYNTESENALASMARAVQSARCRSYLQVLCRNRVGHRLLQLIH